MVADLLEPSSLEAARVDAWRAERFERLGFAADDVRLLVAAEVDWHRAEAMLAGGCDHGTCLWILC